jgi:hypothetical protein
MQGEEQIITHISALESELELNEGLYLFQWQNHIDEDREQQPQVVLQLGQGKAVSRLLVRGAGRSKQQGVCAGGIASCQRRQAPLYKCLHMLASRYHASFLNKRHSVKGQSLKYLHKLYEGKQYFYRIPEY